ncbi:MAG TPA: hypothetical protein VF741_06485 [Candidatus Aquilonibacter sp.]
MGHRRGLVAGPLLVALAFAVAAAQEERAPLDRSDAYFAHALARMNSLPTPPSFTYTAHVRTDGGTFAMYPSANTIATIFDVGNKGASGSADGTLTFSFDQRDRSIYLIGGAAPLGVAQTPIFDPTWNSAFRWMQNRRLFAVDVVTATPAPQPTGTPLKTIATVSGSPALSYHVVSSEPARCANGDTGWQLHVVPVTDPLNHPLVGVLVDDRTGLVCAAQFEEAVRSEPESHARGTVELRFSQINGYYVMTDESLMLHLNSEVSRSGMSATITLSQFNIH